MKNRKNHKCLVILVNNESDTDREKKAKKIIEVKLEKANQKYNATKEGRNIKQQVSLYTNTKEGQRKMVTLDVYGDNKVIKMIINGILILTLTLGGEK